MKNVSFLICKLYIFIIFFCGKLNTTSLCTFSFRISKFRILGKWASERMRELSDRALWVSEELKNRHGNYARFYLETLHFENKICTLHYWAVCLSLFPSFSSSWSVGHDELNSLLWNNIANNMFKKVTGQSLTEWLTN